MEEDKRLGFIGIVINDRAVAGEVNTTLGLFCPRHQSPRRRSGYGFARRRHWLDCGRQQSGAWRADCKAGQLTRCGSQKRIIQKSAFVK